MGSWRHLRKDIERHINSFGGNRHDAAFYVQEIYDILNVRTPTAIASEIQKWKSK